MPTPIKSSSANILPFFSSIPTKYWKQGAVPAGSILLIGKPAIDTEHLYMMVYSPTPGTVSYTGDSIYPQFSELALGNQYKGQCAAFAKVVCDMRLTSTEKWKPFQSLPDFALTLEGHTPNEYRGLMIACFDGKPNYALAAGNRKHVAIILDIIRFANGNPKALIVVDQNYYNYSPYLQYTGKIAKHTIPWGTINQKGVGFARNYHIVSL